MKVPATQRALDRFEDRNAFLHAVLGLVSLGATLDRLVETSSRPGTLPPAEDDLLLGLLGIVALRAHLGRELEAIAGADLPSLERDEPIGQFPGTNLLR